MAKFTDRKTRVRMKKKKNTGVVKLANLAGPRYRKDLAKRAGHKVPKGKVRNFVKPNHRKHDASTKQAISKGMKRYWKSPAGQQRRAYCKKKKCRVKGFAFPKKYLITKPYGMPAGVLKRLKASGAAKKGTTPTNSKPGTRAKQKAANSVNPSGRKPASRTMKPSASKPANSNKKPRTPAQQANDRRLGERARARAQKNGPVLGYN